MSKLAGAFVLGLTAWAGCTSSSDNVSQAWYEQAEVVCWRPGCPNCRGAGNVGCRPCLGAGWTRCGRCRSGKVSCGTCKGDGSYKGKPCKSCGGDGRQTCSSCGGDTRIDCDICDSKGRLHCLRPVRVSEPPPGPEDVWPRRGP